MPREKTGKNKADQERSLKVRRVEELYKGRRSSYFMRSLKENWDGKLIAVIVSGYDGDGAAALCGIKEVGGITIAQKPDIAVQQDMPESAIASGCIDFVLAPEEIALEIARIVHADQDTSEAGS